MSMAPGYWCGTVLVQDMAALLRGALPFWRRSSRNTAALPMKSP
jgi:hypothetical protein